jgi:hypothetical protein
VATSDISGAARAHIESARSRTVCACRLALCAQARNHLRQTTAQQTLLQLLAAQRAGGSGYQQRDRSRRARHVVKVYDFGIDQDGSPFYTMELVHGQHPGADGPMPWRDVCRLLVTLCGPLALLHSRGWVHRDVSPRNVYVMADGTAKLLDFGAIAALDAAHRPMGTPACVAPETLRRQRIDARTDLYGLGALGYCADEIDSCDAESLRLILQLQRRASSARCVFVVSQREGRPGASTALQNLLREASVIELGALDAANVESLMGSLFGDVPNLPRVAGWVRASSAGQFAACVNAAKALVVSGQARFSAGSWHLPDRLDETAVNAGQLFRIAGGSLQLLAACRSRPDPRLLRAAEQCLASWMASDEGSTAPGGALDSLAPSAAGAALTPLWLTDPVRPDEPIGLVLLTCPVQRLASLSPAFVRAVAQQLEIVLPASQCKVSSIPALT